MNLTLGSEQILITIGASEALIFIFMICCDPGDEIIIFDPTYANYMGFAAISGVNLKPLTCVIENNFALPDKKSIESEITHKTKAILLCNPNNPTGTAYSREELQRLVEICNEKNLFLIVDETYREFVYDNLKPLSVLELESNNDRIIVIDSLSKRFSLCGSRIGCLITSNNNIMKAALNLAQARLAGPTIEQYAAVKLLNSINGNFMSTVKNEFEKRRNILFEEIQKIPNITALKPNGAFYTIVRLPVADAEDFCSFLLSDFSSNNETTFIAPASGFYMKRNEGLNKVRIAYVLNDKDLKRAVQIIGEGLIAYNRQ